MIKSICFVGADVYPVLNCDFGSGYIGGESVQLTLLAKAFTELGWRVSVVDKDYGQPEGEIIGGIEVNKTFKENEGIPVFRFVYPRLTGLYNALRRANADVYYQSCSAMMTGVVAWFCKKYQRKFVFRTSLDTDCIRGKQDIKFWRDRKLYEYGLRRADLIAVQGINQEKLLNEHYGLKGFPVNMAVEIPLDNEARTGRDIDCLWVNNMRPFKRPELFIDLVRSLPDYRFVMIGGPCPGFERYYKKISDLAKQMQNLEFMGPVPYSSVNSYYLRAKVFINTSEIEGFPNSFLQAWVRNVPVISFFDPDGLIARHGLGFTPHRIEDMASAIQGYMNDATLRREVGEKAKEFSIQHYSPASVAQSYIELFRKMRIL